jgi:hypothetical protein
VRYFIHRDRLPPRGPAGQQRHHGEEQRYSREDLSGLRYLHCLCPGWEMAGSAQPLVGQMIHRLCLRSFQEFTFVCNGGKLWGLLRNRLAKAQHVAIGVSH